MNLWHIYEFLAQIVHPYMAERDQCLYNALAVKIADADDDYLLGVRDSALEVVKWVEQELADRQVERAEADYEPSDAVLVCPDCDRPNQFGQVCDSCERDRQDEIEEMRG